MNDKRLFPKFQKAVEALSECCRTEDGKEIPPIARSEVYNETWMLRLTLALLHDYKGGFKIKNGKKTILEGIRKAVRKRWISEGGLHPAFKHEGPTWADAVIGDIDLGTKMKREIIVKALDRESTGIIVIEAKIGSKLSKGITHEKQNYNQAARNIACLAKLVRGQPQNKNRVSSGNCGFVVLGPEGKVREWQGMSECNKLFESNQSPLLKQIEARSNNDPDFCCDAQKILANSSAISWEEVLDSMLCQCHCDDNLRYVANFYKCTIEVADSKCQLSREFYQKFGVKFDHLLKI